MTSRRRCCGLDRRINHGIAAVLLLLLLAGEAALTAAVVSRRSACPAFVLVQRAGQDRRHCCDPRHSAQPSQSVGHKTRSRGSLTLRSASNPKGDGGGGGAGGAAAADQPSPPATSYTIRDCAYADLHRVADLILSSFYDPSVASPWRQLYRMGELNRIQQGFAYPAQRDSHRMLVAIVGAAAAAAAQEEPVGAAESDPGSGRIIGFCDVDGRPPNRPTGFAYNPRPYLSDLCTDPAYRRQGVAKALVEQCEAYCRDGLNEPFVYIRVERHNDAAIRLYEGMGYRTVENESETDPTARIAVTGRMFADPSSSSSDKIRLLRKDLRLNSTTAVLDQAQQFSIAADQGL